LVLGLIFHINLCVISETPASVAKDLDVALEKD